MAGGDALPVLWLLDGATLFPLVADAIDWLCRRPDANGVAPMLVVGVDREVADRDRRYRDFSFGPAADPAGQLVDPAWGGAAQFAAFLCGEARRTVEADLAAQATSHALLGHSMGGLFALHLLAERPGAFAATGAISPSIWWDREALRASLQRMPDCGQSVFLGAGSLEQPSGGTGRADDRRRHRRMIGNLEQVADQLTGTLSSAQVQMHIAARETHASALWTLLPAFLRFVTNSACRG